MSAGTSRNAGSTRLGPGSSRPAAVPAADSGRPASTGWAVARVVTGGNCTAKATSPRSGVLAATTRTWASGAIAFPPAFMEESLAAAIRGATARAAPSAGDFNHLSKLVGAGGSPAPRASGRAGPVVACTGVRKGSTRSTAVLGGLDTGIGEGRGTLTGLAVASPTCGGGVGAVAASKAASSGCGGQIGGAPPGVLSPGTCNANPCTETAASATLLLGAFCCTLTSRRSPGAAPGNVCAGSGTAVPKFRATAAAGTGWNPVGTCPVNHAAGVPPSPCQVAWLRGGALFAASATADVFVGPPDAGSESASTAASSLAWVAVAPTLPVGEASGRTGRSAAWGGTGSAGAFVANRALPRAASSTPPTSAGFCLDPDIGAFNAGAPNTGAPAIRPANCPCQPTVEPSAGISPNGAAAEASGDGSLDTSGRTACSPAGIPGSVAGCWSVAWALRFTDSGATGGVAIPDARSCPIPSLSGEGTASAVHAISRCSTGNALPAFSPTGRASPAGEPASLALPRSPSASAAVAVGAPNSPSNSAGNSLAAILPWADAEAPFWPSLGVCPVSGRAGMESGIASAATPSAIADRRPNCAASFFNDLLHGAATRKCLPPCLAPKLCRGADRALPFSSAQILMF